jgi:DNA-binding NarL/FixJ family response regulator
MEILAELTHRQRQIAQLLQMGMSDTEIAYQRQVNESTVKISPGQRLPD